MQAGRETRKERDMSIKKSAGNSPGRKPRKPKKVPQAHGGALLDGGVPGNKGGGRPPDEFKRRMRELASLKQVETYLIRCLTGREGPKAFVAALKHCTAHGYGLPKGALELMGEAGGPIEITVRRELTAATNRIAKANGARGNGHHA
jgi:hypothetical protein